MRAKELCRSLYETLDTETGRGRVVMPSAGIYRSVFAWDSGWHYYWLRVLNKERAVEELLTLFSYQYSDGKIPHEVPLSAGEAYPAARRLALFLLRHGFDEQGNSWFIDPPVYLAAALDAAEDQNTGKEPRRILLEAVDRKLVWIEANRCPTYAPAPWDRLPVIMHPLESGTDFSPSFDEAWGAPPLLPLKAVTLLKRIKKSRWALGGAGMFGLPLVYDLTYTTFYLLTRVKRRPAAHESRALLKEFFNASFDKDALLFRQYHLKGATVFRTEIVTLSSMLPCLLFTKGEFQKHCRAAVERHCLPGKTFWRGDLPSFNPESRSKKSKLLWRGSCSWMNMNYLVMKLLVANGFNCEANLLFQRLWEYLDACGPREYFDAFTKRGGGAEVFSWNGLMLAMEKELEG